MNKKDKLIKKLDSIISSYKELDEACDKAIEIGCLEPEGKLWNSIWGAFETMLDQIDYEIDPSSGGWIAWYIWDNECGSKGLSVKFENKKNGKPIRTSEDLAKVILKNIVNVDTPALAGCVPRLVSPSPDRDSPCEGGSHP